MDGARKVADSVHYSLKSIRVAYPQIEFALPLPYLRSPFAADDPFRYGRIGVRQPPHHIAPFFDWFRLICSWAAPYPQSWVLDTFYTFQVC